MSLLFFLPKPFRVEQSVLTLGSLCLLCYVWDTQRETGQLFFLVLRCIPQIAEYAKGIW